MYKAVFLDRDGVINKLERATTGERGYILKWEDFQWCDGAIEGLKLLSETEYELIVVSNQSCVGRGLVHENPEWGWKRIRNIFNRMVIKLLDEDVELYYYFCPHTPDDNCACRKPKPGLIYQAAVEHEIVLEDSWMIGDSETDIGAAMPAGIRRIVKIDELMKKGQKKQPVSVSSYTGEFVILYTKRDLLEAAKVIP